MSSNKIVVALMSATLVLSVAIAPAGAITRGGAIEATNPLLSNAHSYCKGGYWYRHVCTAWDYYDNCIKWKHRNTYKKCY